MNKIDVLVNLLLKFFGFGTVISAGFDNLSGNRKLYQQLQSVSISNVGSTTILVNGQQLGAAQFVSWSVNQTNEVLASIEVDCTDATLGSGSALVVWTKRQLQ